MLAFMSVTGYAGMVNLQRLTVELIAPDEAYAGQSAPCTLRVTNRKRRFPSFLLVFSCGDASAAVAQLRSATTVSLPLECNFLERGRARISAVQVSSPFPVNFFVRSWRLPVACELLVYPRLVPCLGLGSGDEGAHPAEGQREQRGYDGELERIVDYGGRESLRQIHWKLSARTGQFKVKKYQTAAAEPLVIDLDALAGGLEERVSCAAWMVHHWSLQRPVGLRLGETLLPAMPGRRQMQRLLAALALHGKAA